MDKKDQRILAVLASLTLFVVLLGTTFAFFSATSKSEPQIITTSSLSLSVSIKGSTHIENIKPTTWTSIDAAENNTDISKIPFAVTAPKGVKATYDIKMETQIPSNSTLSGGSATDIKYKLFKVGENTVLKEGSLSANFTDDILTNIPINEGVELNEQYILYVYIENKNVEQNTLQDIDFSINLTGVANQID